MSGLSKELTAQVSDTTMLGKELMLTNKLSSFSAYCAKLVRKSSYYDIFSLNIPLA
jgi:hypothetical protein